MTDAVEAIDDETRKQIESIADPAEARQRLDANDRETFDRLEEQIAKEDATVTGVVGV